MPVVCLSPRPGAGSGTRPRFDRAPVALSAPLAVGRAAPRRTRVYAGCEVVMATAMLVSALAMV